MFTVELYAKIRRAVMVDGVSRREAARQFGIHRNTIAKMLQFSVPPGYRRRERPASKKLEVHTAWIDAVLEGDRSVHKKQRHTALRIFERLRDERGYLRWAPINIAECNLAFCIWLQPRKSCVLSNLCLLSNKAMSKYYWSRH